MPRRTDALRPPTLVAVAALIALLAMTALCSRLSAADTPDDAIVSRVMDALKAAGRPVAQTFRYDGRFEEGGRAFHLVTGGENQEDPFVNTAWYHVDAKTGEMQHRRRTARRNRPLHDGRIPGRRPAPGQTQCRTLNDSPASSTAKVKPGRRGGSSRQRMPRTSRGGIPSRAAGGNALVALRAAHHRFARIPPNLAVGRHFFTPCENPLPGILRAPRFRQAGGQRGMPRPGLDNHVSSDGARGAKHSSRLALHRRGISRRLYGNSPPTATREPCRQIRSGSYAENSSRHAAGPSGDSRPCPDLRESLPGRIDSAILSSPYTNRRIV